MRLLLLLDGVAHSKLRLCASSAARYPLEALLHDCREFMRATGRRPTFEYTLLAGVNDSLAQVRVHVSRLCGSCSDSHLI